MKYMVPASVFGLMLLSGCASTGIPSLTESAPKTASEHFAYAPASNGHVRVEVDNVVMKGDPDFIPTDPNWVQLRVRITNVGSRTITVSGGGEQLANGTVVRNAQTGNDIVKPPSVGKQLLMSSGGIIGALVFPPALLLGVAADVALPIYSAGKLERVVKRVNTEALRVGPVAPGTSVSGLIFVPAVTGQTGLVLFYEENGKTQSVSIPRT